MFVCDFKSLSAIFDFDFIRISDSFKIEIIGLEKIVVLRILFRVPNKAV